MRKQRGFGETGALSGHEGTEAKVWGPQGAASRLKPWLEPTTGGCPPDLIWEAGRCQGE